MLTVNILAIESCRIPRCPRAVAAEFTGKPSATNGSVICQVIWKYIYLQKLKDEWV